ncbi:hypothetical protein KM043_014701 [Ampulex compressa]|nr:hypothetical protein KM043_014701 [Ampulex compressa]
MTRGLDGPPPDLSFAPAIPPSQRFSPVFRRRLSILQPHRPRLRRILDRTERKTIRLSRSPSILKRSRIAINKIFCGGEKKPARK